MRSITVDRFYFYLVQVFPNGNNAINCGYVLTSHFTFDRITKSCVSASLDSFDVLFSFYFLFRHQPTNLSIDFPFTCITVCLFVYYVHAFLCLAFVSWWYILLTICIFFGCGSFPFNSHSVCVHATQTIYCVCHEKKRERERKIQFLILFYLVLFSTIQLWFIESEMNIKGKYASNSLVSGAWWIERITKSVYVVIATEFRTRTQNTTTVTVQQQ